MFSMVGLEFLFSQRRAVAQVVVSQHLGDLNSFSASLFRWRSVATKVGSCGRLLWRRAIVIVAGLQRRVLLRLLLRVVGVGSLFRRVYTRVDVNTWQLGV